MKSCFLFYLLCVTSFSVASAQAVFFSESFNGGLPSSWKSIKVQGNNTPSASWVWTRTGAQGSFPTPALRSTTASNGWMIFDSDLNCSQNVQDAWLVAPKQSGVGKEAVFVTFQTLYRTFNDEVTIQVSKDSINWTSFVIFPDIEANEFGGEGNPARININISSVAAGAEKFWFAFRFLSDNSTINGGDGIGCGYSWQVDDVALDSFDPRAQNDLSIIPDGIGVAPNLITPISQIDPFGFLTNIENVGSKTQNNIKLSLSIVDAVSDETVFTEEITVDSVEVDSSLSIIFEKQFTPKAERSVYRGNYNLALSNNDADTTNNNREFAFGISDTLFSKYLNVTGGLRPGGENYSYAYGNCFYVPKGEGFFGRFVTFEVSNPEELTDRSVTILTYKWEGDTNEDFLATPDEYAGGPIAFNGYTFTGDETGPITIPLNIDEVGVPLENDTHYFVVVQYETSDNQPLFMAISDEIDYTNMFLWSVLVNNNPRYSTMIDVGNTGEYDIRGFGFDVVPAIDMSIGGSPDLFTSLAPALAAEHNISIGPNPASDFATIQLDFASPLQLSLRLIDAKGKVLYRTLPSTLQQESIKINTSSYAAGTYFLHVETEKGVRTLPLQIVR